MTLRTFPQAISCKALALVIASFSLAGCAFSQNQSPTPTLYIIPTWPPPTALPTEVIVIAENQDLTAPTADPVLEPTATTSVLEATETASSTPTRTQQSPLTEPCVNDAELVADSGFPNNASIDPNFSFTKDWAIRNTGTCEWAIGYLLSYESGTILSDIPIVVVPQTLPGETVSISLTVTSPSSAGSHESIWRMVSPEGKKFGDPFVIKVTVLAKVATHTPTPTATLAPSSTPFVIQTPTALPPTATSVPSPYEKAILNITPRVRDLFLEGQRKGNRANIFSKVGDSITYSRYSLIPVGDGRVNFANFSSLIPVTAYFAQDTARTGNSFTNSSIATYPGWLSMMLIDPMYAGQMCLGQTPLQCEYQLVRPSIALIMIGTNDATMSYSIELYEENLVQIINITVGNGVIPVLFTLPHNTLGDVTPFNRVIVQLASDYQIPLIDYYQLMEQLPARGLNEDGLHPSRPQDGNTADFNPDRLIYGYTVRNLATLHVLDALWKQVIAPPN